MEKLLVEGPLWHKSDQDTPILLLQKIAVGILPKSVVVSGLAAKGLKRTSSPRNPDKVKFRSLAQFIRTMTLKIEADPTLGKNYVKRAMALSLNQDWYGAITDLLTCINLFPSDSRMFFDLGLAYEVVKKRCDAESVYQKAIELSPFLNNTTKTSKKQKIKQILEPYEIYRRRAINLYKGAIEPSSTEKDKTQKLQQARKLIKMACYLFEGTPDVYDVDKKKTLCNDRAVITFHAAFNRETIRDYYETTWEIVRLVILGIQDEKSLFSMFADMYFVWSFIVTNLDPVMKDSGFPDFPGFSFIDPIIFRRIEEAYTYLEGDVNSEYKGRCEYFLNRTGPPEPPKNPFGLPVVDRLNTQCWNVSSVLQDWVGHVPGKLIILKQRDTFPLEDRIEWEPPCSMFRYRLADESVVGRDNLVISDSWWSIQRGILRFTVQDLSFPEGTYVYELERDKVEENVYRGFIRCLGGNIDDVLPGAEKRVKARVEVLPLPNRDIHVRKTTMDIN